MAMIYADEEAAASVMGYGDFSEPYAMVMGVGATRAWGRRPKKGSRALLLRKIAQVESRLASIPPVQTMLRANLTRKLARLRARLSQAGLHGGWETEVSPQVGANIITSLLETVGLRDPLSKYKAKGMTSAQIFARFNAAVNGYIPQVKQIPRGSVQASLQKQLDGVLRQRAALAPAFAPGAKAGTRDEAALAQYVGSVKSFREALKKAMTTYGLRALVADPETGGAEETGGGEVAQFGMGWLWLVPVALLGFLAFKKK